VVPSRGQAILDFPRPVLQLFRYSSSGLAGPTKEEILYVFQSKAFQLESGTQRAFRRIDCFGISCFAEPHLA
jgi:hypothetical protein